MTKATITFEDSANGKLVKTSIVFEPSMPDPIYLKDLSRAQRLAYEAYEAMIPNDAEKAEEEKP